MALRLRKKDPPPLPVKPAKPTQKQIDTARLERIRKLAGAETRDQADENRWEERTGR